MTDIIMILIKCIAAAIIGVIAGNSAVYVFNHVPASWLCEYGQNPSKELLDPYTQRIKSTPWKLIFTVFFVIMGIRMVMDSWQFAIAGGCALWLLLEMTISDIKYRIVPDQFIILLAVSALGFIPFHGEWTDALIGCIIGFGVTVLIALIGKIVYKRDSMGGGDIKLFASLGLLSGPGGIAVIFVITTLISAVHLIYLLTRKKIKRGDSVPMVPYIFIASVIYIVFLWGFERILYL